MTINPAPPATVADHARIAIPGRYHFQMTGYVMGHHDRPDPSLGNGTEPLVDLVLGEDFIHGAFRVESTDPAYWAAVREWAASNEEWCLAFQAGSAVPDLEAAS